MAIWQYQLFVIPEDEANSYFPNADFISLDAFNEIEWWKYRKIGDVYLKDIEHLLPLGKSWSNNIYLFGNIESDCLEILSKDQKILEISIRLDLRNDYANLIESICKFGSKNNLVFLNHNLKLLYPRIIILKEDIDNYDLFDEFIRRNQ